MDIINTIFSSSPIIEIKQTIMKKIFFILSLIVFGFSGLHAQNSSGFISLFNGRNLDGWTGNKAGYLVENGAIVVHPGEGSSGGNLYTEKEFGNFVLRFQFKLTPGANNGIGIRAPLDGDAAYVGMEIQVL